MNYWKLNSIMVRDAFSLPRIDEALQAIYSRSCFLSFDLAQRYLQLVMEESNIKKTAFRDSSMGLYRFTHMPFGLSNVGSSFCHLIEQCFGDQQFVTLLLCINEVCNFATTINDMLDWIKLVFTKLKQFSLKFKSKKCQFSNTSVLFLGDALSAKGISAKPEKVEKVKNWPVPKNFNEVLSFLDYHITGDSLINLPGRHDSFMSLWVQPLIKPGRKPGLKRTRLLLLNQNRQFLNGWWSIGRYLMPWRKHSILLQYWDIPISPGNLYWRLMLP